MRLIDADGVKKCAAHAQIYTKHLNDDGSVTYEMHVTDAVTVKDIENAPTVDAVEVVRCKDCTSLYDGWCIDYGIHMDDNEFCSGGERRQTDETD